MKYHCAAYSCSPEAIRFIRRKLYELDSPVKNVKPENFIKIAQTSLCKKEYPESETIKAITEPIDLLVNGEKA